MPPSLPQNFRANHRMLAHDLPLLIIQRTGLEQHGIRYADLAHVMHGSRVQQIICPLRGATHRQCMAVMAHAQHMHAGFVVLVLSGSPQALHDLQTRLAQCLNIYQRQVHARA